MAIHLSAGYANEQIISSTHNVMRARALFQKKSSGRALVDFSTLVKMHSGLIEQDAHTHTRRRMLLNNVHLACTNMAA